MCCYLWTTHRSYDPSISRVSSVASLWSCRNVFEDLRELEAVLIETLGFSCLCHCSSIVNVTHIDIVSFHLNRCRNHGLGDGIASIVYISVLVQPRCVACRSCDGMFWELVMRCDSIKAR
jgi:hypothetical protein